MARGRPVQPPGPVVESVAGDLAVGHTGAATLSAPAWPTSSPRSSPSKKAASLAIADVPNPGMQREQAIAAAKADLEEEKNKRWAARAAEKAKAAPEEPIAPVATSLLPPALAAPHLPAPPTQDFLAALPPALAAHVCRHFQMQVPPAAATETVVATAAAKPDVVPASEPPVMPQTEATAGKMPQQQRSPEQAVTWNVPPLDVAALLGKAPPVKAPKPRRPRPDAGFKATDPAAKRKLKPAPAASPTGTSSEDDDADDCPARVCAREKDTDSNEDDEAGPAASISLAESLI